MKEQYTLEDLSLITGLTGRTLRTYIKKGYLKGEMKEKWLFTAEEVGDFLDNPNIKPAVMTKHNAILYDFMGNTFKEQDSACYLLDMPVRNSKDAQAISNRMCSMVNTNIYGAVQFSFRFENKLARIILTGEPKLLTSFIGDYYSEFFK